MRLAGKLKNSTRTVSLLLQTEVNCTYTFMSRQKNHSVTGQKLRTCLMQLSPWSMGRRSKVLMKVTLIQPIHRSEFMSLYRPSSARGMHFAVVHSHHFRAYLRMAATKLSVSMLSNVECADDVSMTERVCYSGILITALLCLSCFSCPQAALCL